MLLRGHLRRRRRGLAAVFAWSAVEAIPALALGRCLAGATDAFVARRPLAGLCWLAALWLAAVAGAAGARRVILQVGQLVEPLRDDLVRSVVEGALRRSTRPGAAPDTGAVARISRHVEIVRDTFAGILVMLGAFVFSAGGALVGLVTLAPAGIALVLPPLVVALGAFAALLPASARRQRAAVLADEAVAEAAAGAVEHLRDVVACAGEDAVGAEIAARVEAQARCARALARLAAARTLALALGGWLPFATVLAAAPWLLRRGVTAGALLGLLAYVRGGLQPALHGLGQGVGGSGSRLAVTLDRIVSAGDAALSAGAPPAPTRVSGEAGRPAASHPGVETRALTFAYGPAAEPIVRDLDLVLRDGDHLAVVGPSGVGKSTLAGLLAGTLLPLRGEVRYGGVPLAELDPAAVTRHRVLIPQEAYVFAGTLRENLAYLNDETSQEALDAAVRALGLGPLLARAGGYQGDLDPLALSAGERQLVALARAYVSPAHLAVLDEATCHLHPAAEARVEAAFARRPGSLVVVAHRASSALRARRILLLDGARALSGTHRDLLRDSPLYRELLGYWRSAGVAPDARGRSSPCERTPGRPEGAPELTDEAQEAAAEEAPRSPA